MTQEGQHLDLSDLDLRSNFEIDLSRSPCICFDASRRQKHDGVKIISLPLLVKKIYAKTVFAKKRLFWHLMTPGAKTIDSSSNLRCKLQKERSKSYRVLFRFLSSCYGSRDNGRFSWEETVILQNLTFDDLWWPENWPERKNDRNDFERSHWKLSIAFFRVFLALLVFELVGGSFWPPGRGLRAGFDRAGFKVSCSWLQAKEIALRLPNMSPCSQLMHKPCNQCH